MRQKFHALIHQWLLPQVCRLCQSAVTGELALCAPCLRDLPRNLSCCACCALPLPLSVPRCGRCLKKQPLVTQLIAPYLYAHPIDSLVLRFKKSADLASGELLGTLFLSSLAEQATRQTSLAEQATRQTSLAEQATRQTSLAEQATRQTSLAEQATRQAALELPNLKLPQALCPVPLHINRLRERGFDQALLLTEKISRQLKIPICDTLIRIRDTGSQGGLRAEARQRNVRGAFLVPQPLALKHVALVDDVATTTATLNACALALKRAGVKRVDAWVLARA
jgi:ComF family protein